MSIRIKASWSRDGNPGSAVRRCVHASSLAPVLVAFLLLVAVSLVVAGCGGTEKVGDQSPATSVQPQTTATAQCTEGRKDVTTSTVMEAYPDNPPPGQDPLVQTVIFYSAPRLDMEPRDGVKIEVSLSMRRATDEPASISEGVLASIEIENRSGSSFLFSPDDLQLFVNCTSAEQETASRAQEVPDTGEGVHIYVVAFGIGDFDPSVSGLVYVSSDPASDGFTQTDGAVPVEYVHEP